MKLTYLDYKLIKFNLLYYSFRYLSASFLINGFFFFNSYSFKYSSSYLSGNSGKYFGSAFSNLWKVG